MRKLLKLKNNLRNNRGVTGTDIVLSIIVISIFTGFIANLMYNAYLQEIEVQKAAIADANATIILEKVDEKAYEDIPLSNTNQFITNMVSSDEIFIDQGYTINLSAQEVRPNLLKKVVLTISYKVNNVDKQLVITKVKVKEK